MKNSTNIEIVYTLIPLADGIAQFPKITRIRGKRQDNIVLAGVVFAILVECNGLVVVDDWVDLLVLLLDVASGVFIDDVDSMDGIRYT